MRGNSGKGWVINERENVVMFSRREHRFGSTFLSLELIASFVNYEKAPADCDSVMKGMWKSTILP